jgi:Tfp pilus assembly protein PilF
MSVTALVFALMSAIPPTGHPPPASVAALIADPATEALAARPLAAGRMAEALAVLEKASAANPHDAGVMINLGIAYAQAGEDAKARTAFEAALACEQVVELETADGTVTDSRRLARRALRMLARGEFRAAPGALTYRQ